jgi:hypothetical protein
MNIFYVTKFWNKILNKCFWIHIEFTKTLGQLKWKAIFWFIHEMLVYVVFFNIVNLIFISYNNLFEYIIE